MDERPKKRWGLFLSCAALISALLTYPLSWGPAAWYIQNHQDSRTLVDAYWTVYAPLYRLYEVSPDSVQNAMNSYISLWYRPSR